MLKTSLRAYYNKDNQEKRLSHRELIKKIFQGTNGKYTSREIARLTGYSLEEVKKRISEINASGYIYVIGQKEELENSVSIYHINREPELFQRKKKTKLSLLRSAIKKSVNHHVSGAILEEYDRLLNYQNKSYGKGK